MAWQARALAGQLQAWADFKQTIRAFFAERGVLEVDTPLLAAYCVSDPHLDAIAAAGGAAWLQTSPESAMKRLLASRSGDIYQICKAFRADECGRLHNQEFTLLEWYRCAFDLSALMAETAELLGRILPDGPLVRYSYADLFLAELAVDPHVADLAELQDLARSAAGLGVTNGLERDELLDCLFSHCIQPGLTELSFVFDYPASQAALAQTTRDDNGREIASRFECFYAGVELANAYHELLDADQYQRRHAADNRRRRQLGKPQIELDQQLLAAMQHGLPDCSGIAMGLERVFMVARGVNRIEDIVNSGLGAGPVVGS